MKVTHGAVMAECFDPDYRMLNADLLMDQEPGVGQVSVVVLQTKDYMALTADRDRYRRALERVAVNGAAYDAYCIALEALNREEGAKR